jgi:multicomponent Na+:H+ antiporter subunit G
MIEIIKIISAIFIALGVFLALVSALGVIRLPDVYTRNHAASKSTTLGVMSILIGTVLYFYAVHGIFNPTVLLGIFFIFLTSPVGAHLIGLSAYETGVKLWERSVQDDLKMTRLQVKKEQEEADKQEK